MFLFIGPRPMYYIDDQMTLAEIEELKADIDAQHMSEMEEAYLIYHVMALNMRIV